MLIYLIDRILLLFLMVIIHNIYSKATDVIGITPSLMGIPTAPPPPPPSEGGPSPHQSLTTGVSFYSEWFYLFCLTFGWMIMQKTFHPDYWHIICLSRIERKTGGGILFAL